MNKKYTCVFLDMDNTILDFYACERTAIKTTLAKNGLPYDDNTAKIYSKINDSYWKRYETGEIKREDIFVNRFVTLLDTLKIKGDPKKISDDYFLELSKGHDLIDGALDILKYLKQKGYLVYATTNGISKTQFRRIKEAEIEEYFEKVFVSEDVGAQKPDKKYYDFVRLNCKENDKSKILIIGDSQSSDILGGKNSGIDTCWCDFYGEERLFEPTFTVKSLEEIKYIL